MSNTYADRHHPDVVARKLQSGAPLLNDFRTEQWRAKLAELGITMPKAATKAELYRAFYAALGGAR